MRGDRTLLTFGFIAVLGIGACNDSPSPLVETLISPDGTMRAVREPADPSSDMAAELISVVRVGGSSTRPIVVARLRPPLQGLERLFVSWKGPRDLDIAAPLFGAVEISQPTELAVHIRLIPYPFAPITRAYIDAHGHSLQSISSTEFASLLRSSEAQNVVTAAVKVYEHPKPEVQVHDRSEHASSCALTVRFPAEPAKGEVRMTLTSYAPQQQTAGVLEFSLTEPRDGERFLTAAQLSGATFESTSLGLQANGQGGFLETLDSTQQLEKVIEVVSHAPYKIRMLWDYPDRAIGYEIQEPLSRGLLEEFASCRRRISEISKPG